jgi:hypothetical protein
MAKKTATAEQFDLFEEKTHAPEPPKAQKPLLEPTREQVNAEVEKTGKSYRKCYFWVKERLNRQRAA